MKTVHCDPLFYIVGRLFLFFNQNFYAFRCSLQTIQIFQYICVCFAKVVAEIILNSQLTKSKK